MHVYVTCLLHVCYRVYIDACNIECLGDMLVTILVTYMTCACNLNGNKTHACYNILIIRIRRYIVEI